MNSLLNLVLVLSQRIRVIAIDVLQSKLYHEPHGVIHRGGGSMHNSSNSGGQVQSVYSSMNNK